MDKILVVDDEMALRRMLEEHLTREGYQVVCAENGKHGLQLYRKHHPEVIILDLMFFHFSLLSQIVSSASSFDNPAIVERIIVSTGSASLYPYGYCRILLQVFKGIPGGFPLSMGICGSFVFKVVSNCLTSSFSSSIH